MKRNFILGMAGLLFTSLSYGTEYYLTIGLPSGYSVDPSNITAAPLAFNTGAPGVISVSGQPITLTCSTGNSACSGTINGLGLDVDFHNYSAQQGMEASFTIYDAQGNTASNCTVYAESSVSTSSQQGVVQISCSPDGYYQGNYSYPWAIQEYYNGYDTGIWPTENIIQQVLLTNTDSPDQQFTCAGGNYNSFIGGYGEPTDVMLVDSNDPGYSLCALSSTPSIPFQPTNDSAGNHIFEKNQQIFTSNQV